MYNKKIRDHMSFCLIKLGSAQYYKSKNDWVSADFTLVDHEIDATLITDVNDIIYLLEDINPIEWKIQINLGQMFIGEISLADFIEQIGGTN